MGNTPNLTLPYPELTDPADVPADIKRLADRLDVIVHPPLVTSLPGSPVDGQECYYVADAAGGVIWQLRYRAASASTYKWEFVGGGSLVAEDLSAFNTSSATYVNCGPTLTAPLAGDYVILQGAVVEGGAAGWRGRIAYNGVDTEAVYASGQGANANPDGNGISRTLRRTLTASAYTLKARSDAANALNFGFRHMQFVPVRVG